MTFLLQQIPIRLEPVYQLLLIFHIYQYHISFGTEAHRVFPKTEVEIGISFDVECTEVGTCQNGFCRSVEVERIAESTLEITTKADIVLLVGVGMVATNASCAIRKGEVAVFVSDVGRCPEGNPFVDALYKGKPRCVAYA